jgi:hypothetical protein
MALKFRRGTTAQQSGSLAFGEPYVNTTLGTLLIGGPTGDIVLSTTGTGSTGTFGAISGSGLDITGNARIGGNLTLGGNITIGDATTDTVTVTANLSSSLIPSVDNAFDVGSTSKKYRALYGGNISGSSLEINSGSNPEVRLINRTTGIAYHIQNGDGGNLTIHNSNTNKLAAVFPSSSNHPDLILYSSLTVSQSISANSITAAHINGTLSGSFSGSVNGIGNVTTYSSSVATRLTALEVETSNLETFSGSQLGKDATLATLTASYDGRFTTLATYTASVEGRFSTLATLTGSNATRLTNLESTTASLNTSVSNLNTFSASENGKSATLATYTASVDGRFTTIASVTASYDGRFTTLATTTGSLQTSVTNINTFSGSALTRLTALEVETSNLETFSGSQLGKDATLATYTASVDGRFTTLGTYTGSVETRLTQVGVVTGSLITTASINDGRLDAIEAVSGTFARTNSANTFNGTQTISGSLYISQDLIVAGSSSIQTISSSRLDIGDNIIQLNVNSPVARFGGLTINDSGSAGNSGSFLYDSVQDEFIFVHKGNGTNVTSSHFVLGPETYDNLGNESYLTNNRVPKGTGKEHLNDSQISDDGTTVTIPGALTVTGNITGPIRATNGVVSGSSQITYSGLTGIPAGIVSGSSQITSILPAGVVSGSSQVIGILSSLNSYTASNDTTNTTQNSRLDQLSTASGSAITRLTALEVETSNLETYTSSFAAASVALTNKTISGASNTLSNIANASLTNSSITIAGTSTALGSSITAATILQGTGVVSGSSQITAGSTTNFATDVKTQLNSNTVVSGSSQITAGSTTGFATAVKTQLDANTVVSGSRTISGITLGSNLAALTIGTGLSGTSYNGSTGVTIANTGVLSVTTNTGLSTNASATGNVTITNTGVTSNVAGTGISVSGATGAVTITNSGVTSIVAGTGVSRDVATGAVTISIGQAVATSSSPTFAGLTINGAITATGDITAFFTSDKRHKNTIQNIPNALEKVSKLNGVTWEWNEDVNEVTKSTPKTGLIAQEVQEVLPEVVREREDGFLSLDYSKMVGLLVEAIKEQQSQIEELKSKLGYN